MVYFLDTNIFLRYLIPDEPSMHDACVTFFNRARQQNLSLLTSTVVLAEIAWTLKTHYQKSRPEIANLLKSIIHISVLTIRDDYQHHTALKYYQDLNIKFIDCLIASSKHLQNGAWQLISYDQDFDKIKGLKRLEPGQIKV
jgi:predicted nucleic-acid-binding protein